jgi:hypothetical protein
MVCYEREGGERVIKCVCDRRVEPNQGKKLEGGFTHRALCTEEHQKKLLRYTPDRGTNEVEGTDIKNKGRK